MNKLFPLGDEVHIFAVDVEASGRELRADNVISVGFAVVHHNRKTNMRKTVEKKRFPVPFDNLAFEKTKAFSEFWGTSENREVYETLVKEMKALPEGVDQKTQALEIAKYIHAMYEKYPNATTIDDCGGFDWMFTSALIAVADVPWTSLKPVNSGGTQSQDYEWRGSHYDLSTLEDTLRFLTTNKGQQGGPISLLRGAGPIDKVVHTHFPDDDAEYTAYQWRLVLEDLETFKKRADSK